MELTKREKDTLAAIIKLSELHAFAPTVREIALELGLASTSTFGYMNRLENKGYIEREESKPRTLRVIRHA